MASQKPTDDSGFNLLATTTRALKRTQWTRQGSWDSIVRYSSCGLITAL
jgi:hypothetical protein